MKKLLLTAAVISGLFASPVLPTPTASQNGMEFGLVPNEETETILPLALPNGDKTIGVKWKSFKALITDLQKGNEIKKPILVFVAQSTCQYCAKELRDITADQKLSDYINENYYSVYVEQDKEELPKNLFANLVPAFFILNPEDGTPMTSEPASGALPTATLLGYLSQVKAAYDYYLVQKNKPAERPNVVK